MIPDEAVEAAARELFFQHSNTNGPSLSRIWDEALNEDLKSPFMRDARAALEAAAPHMATFSAVAAVRRLHRALPCVDDDGEPVGGFYCEECKDLDGHSGERVHEVYPCPTAREIEAALAGDETWTAMRDRIERGAKPS